MATQPYQVFSSFLVFDHLKNTLWSKMLIISTCSAPFHLGSAALLMQNILSENRS